MIDLQGQTFGKLSVIKDSKKRDKWGKVLWVCKCECGVIKNLPSSRLRRKDGSRSCGCIIKKHGKSKKGKSRIYKIWEGMRSRCTWEKHHAFKYYGARGILVCKEWNDFETFEKWAIENDYSDDLTIERIDVNKGYNPKNCTWITPFKQASNKTNTLKITHKNQTKSLMEWSRTLGIKRGVLHRRIFLYGWTLKQAISAPPFSRKDYFEINRV